ncbi:MAG: hypothetical protein AAF589_08270 [Planctomycetota bacterium]
MSITPENLTAPVVTLDRQPAAYAAGDTLTASVAPPADGGSLRSIELSVAWYTVGKGDEDLHVHEFLRPTADNRDWLSSGLSLSTRLPMSPLSYAGVIVKVCWCVRLRLFAAGGRQLLVEEPFQLGSIRSPTAGAKPEALK